MKLHFFQTNDDFPMAAVLRSIMGRPLTERERVINKKNTFMENHDVVGDYDQMDFTQRRRTHGPGHSRPGRQTVDFSLGDRDGFGEQTCAIWHAPSRYMAVQYNHYGVRSGAIREYLSGFSAAAAGRTVLLDMEPQLRCDTLDRLAAAPVHSNLVCGFDAESIVPTDGTAQLGVPVQRIFEIRNSTNAMKIEVSLSLGRQADTGRYDEHGNQRTLGGIVAMVQQAIGLNPSKLVAKAKFDDGPVEVLDLLDHREVDEIPDSDLPLTSGRRWEFRMRAAAIRERFQAWLLQRPQQ